MAESRRAHPPGGERPTIRTVAERAGVSKSLVSLVLRGSDHVSRERRQAVLAAMSELGYTPNANARSLTERHTMAVGVLMNDLRNQWLVECLDGINHELSPRGMHMLLADGRLDQSTGEPLLRTFVEKRVDGLILVGSMDASPALSAAVAELPTVAAGERDLGIPDLDIVTIDDFYGAELATTHLLELGHRRVAHLAGNYGHFSERRLRSYRETMARHGREDDVVVEFCDATEDGGYRAAIRLLTRDPRPTAIFAVSEMACIGALSAADVLGISVPTDLSLVSHDNTHLAKIRHLSLTGIDFGSFEMGRRAAAYLLDRLEHPQRDAVEHLIRPTLDVRASTGPPPAAPA